MNMNIEPTKVSDAKKWHTFPRMEGCFIPNLLIVVVPKLCPKLTGHVFNKKNLKRTGGRAAQGQPGYRLQGPQ